MRRSVGLWVVLCAVLTGCSVNRDIMFKTPLDYAFDQVPDTLPKAFRIQPNDQITFRLFANDGFRMIDLVDENGAGQRNLQRATFNYQVDFDGRAKMPLLGLVPLAGLTIREAELMLEEQYTEFYNRPFVQVQVNTRRVIVFPGGGGDARVVPLENSNTTLMEALAAAGGLNRRADARKVKLFRSDSTGVRKVYQFDLSDISGLKHADMVMLADDIVYVQPNPEIARELLNDINPFITLLTTTVLVIGIVRGFSQ
ncbi:MAG: polysaccharide biosynthesis/export family protein [Flavobacteriales bacterium]|nr:polysaccharide biosynthesis/export family protein [Flavobacteriales bacterium]